MIRPDPPGTITWGKSRKSKTVHCLVSGSSLCGKMTGKVDMIFPGWDPRDKATCLYCQARYGWAKRGGVKVRE